MQKKWLSKLILAAMLVCTVCVFAFGCESGTQTDQGKESVESNSEVTENLGDYKIAIKSCRLAKDYDGKDVAIVNYGFTNNSEDAADFMMTFNAEVYQDGVGLNESYFLAENANYSSDNQTKSIKKGASLDVEVAYELNDTTTDLEVEVSELFSFSDSVVKKTFSLTE